MDITDYNSEHVTPLPRPYQSEVRSQPHKNRTLTSSSAFEVVPGPVVGHQPRRPLPCSNLPVACCHNAVVNVQCPRATCARELSVNSAELTRASRYRTDCTCRNAAAVHLRNDMFFVCTRPPLGSHEPQRMRTLRAHSQRTIDRSRSRTSILGFPMPWSALALVNSSYPLSKVSCGWVHCLSTTAPASPGHPGRQLFLLRLHAV
jgi:hypothetical protein